MTSDVPTFSDIHLFWEIDHLGQLTIALRAPVGYLRKFTSPSDVLFKFMAALHAQGVDVATATEVRTKIDSVRGTFLVRWTGEINSDHELARSAIPALASSLGVKSFGSDD